MAHLSGDTGLRGLPDGEDLHRFVGSRVFGVDPADAMTAGDAQQGQGDELRAAIIWPVGLRLSKHWVSRPVARGLMDEYFARFWRVRDHLRDVVVEAGKQGYTETMFGRRRCQPDLTSDNRQRREMAERMALNRAAHPGSAADIMKVAMLGVDRELTAGARPDASPGA